MEIAIIKKNYKINKILAPTMTQKMEMKKIIKSSSRKCSNVSVPTRQLEVKIKDLTKSKKMKETVNLLQCQYKVK